MVRERDYSGLISFGILLLVVGVVFMVNSNISSDFRLWVEGMTNAQHLARPPEGLLASAILFFGLIGLFDLVQASARFRIRMHKRRILVDLS